MGHPPPKRSWLPHACGLSAAVFYALLGAPFGHAHDAGELVAAGFQLGVPHPPGHPLAVLLMRAAMYLPLGPLPWRATLASAVLLGCAVGLLCQAYRVGLAALLPGSLSTASGRVREVLAVVGTLIFASAPGVVLQGVRPEVYALHAALGAGLLERLTLAFSSGVPGRPVRQASLLFGLGLANHHLLMLCLAPCLWFALVHRPRPRASTWACGACAAFGLLVYAVLPLRAARAPGVNLGVPDQLDRFFWVVSAQVYQRSALGQAGESLERRLSETWIAWNESLGVAGVLAILGAYLLLRIPRTRRLGGLFMVALLPTLLVRAQMGAVAGNPDAHGYLLLAYAAAAFFAVAGLAVVLAALGARGGAALRSLGAVVVLGACGLAALHVQRGSQESLADAFLVDEFAWLGRAHLPARAVVIAWTPQTIFAHWGAEAIDGLRPDIEFVPVPFVGYPGVASQLTRSAPFLAGLINGLRTGRLRPEGGRALRALSRVRPVITELDVRVPEGMLSGLTPAARDYRVHPDPVALDDVEPAAERQGAALAQLQGRLDLDYEHASARELLLWHHFNSAVYLAGWGARSEALRRIALAEQLFALPHELAELRDALKAPGSGPIPVAAFRQHLTP